MSYVDVASIHIRADTFFMEAGYPEVWRVTKCRVTEQGMNGVIAKVVGWLPGTPMKWRTRLGEESFWGAAPNHNPPTCYQVSSYETNTQA